MTDNNIKFGTFEAYSLLTMLMITKIFYSSPTYLIRVTGTAAWYVTITSCLVALIVFFFSYLLIKRFENKNLVDILEMVYGKIIGKIIISIFSAYLIFYVGSNVREFVEMIKAYNLPYTPPSIIITAFFIVICIASYFGVESVARLSTLFFVPILIVILIIILLSIPNYDVSFLLPIGGFGLKSNVIFGIIRSSAYSEFLVLAFLVKTIHGKKYYKKVGIYSILSTGFIFSILMICILMVFGYRSGSEYISGLFELSRAIYFNRFFQRVESLFLGAWVIASLIAMSVAMVIAINIYCQAFKINDHRPIIIPFAILCLGITLFPENYVDLLQHNITFIRSYSYIPLYSLIILTLILSYILPVRKKVKKNENKEC